MKSLILFAIALGLAGCATKPVPAPEPIIVPQKVAVAVDAPCVPDSLKSAPVYVDSIDALKAAVDAADRMQLLYGGRAQREARLNEIEPIIAACPHGSVKKK